MLPVVLHHGIFGYDHLQVGPVRIAYFGGGIEQEIAARGHAVIRARVSRLGSVAVRAEQLKQIILNELHARGTPDGRVIVLAHSMGGLDVRYMIRALEMARHVAAVVTLSTPHRGSSYADWILNNIDRSRKLQQLLSTLRLDLSGARDCTIDACQRFNDAVPDHPDVAYYSVGASRPWHRVPPYFMHAHKVVGDAEGDNDGIVSVASSRWGMVLDPWPADHLHMVGRKMVVELVDPTGDITPYYHRIFDRLAADGVIERSTAALIDRAPG